MDITSKITMLDEAFSAYLLNQNEQAFCKDVAVLLNGFSRKSFSVLITEKTPAEKEPFFGMRVFPDKQAMDDLCVAITADTPASIKDMIDRWKKINSWVIEIDRRVFDRSLINFNPSELTAMLLHEVGHTVYSDKKIEMFYRIYRECQVRLKTTDRIASKFLYFLYEIPLALVCGIREWQITSFDLREEIFADSSVSKLGYGEHLISAYDKIVKACGSGGYTNQSNMEKSIAQSITWCNINIADLDRRKQKIKDELYNTGERTHSSYIQGMIRNIMKNMHLYKKERYTGNVVMESDLSIEFSKEFVLENTLVYNMPEFNKLKNGIRSVCEMHENKIATEAFNFGKKKMEIPSQLDIDTIFIEIDRMQNHADRRYVLDLIYDQEEKIEKFKEYFRYNEDLKKKYSGKMDSMLRELDSMRKAVLSKRSFDKQYKVFVKYPEGYEG